MILPVHHALSRSSKKLLLKGLPIGLLLLACYGAWSAGKLRAEGVSQKNFTYVRPEEMNQIENLHERAERLMEQRDFRGAIDVYSEILLIEPDDDAAYTNMAQAYMVLGDFEHAGDAFENAIHINPDNELARFGLRKIADPDFSSVETPTQRSPGPIKVTAPLAAPSPAITVAAKIQPSPVPVPAAVPPVAPFPTPLKTEINSSTSSPVSGNNTGLALNTDLTFNQLSQIALKNAGFYHGPPDGKLNETTRKAVEAFQAKNRLEIDGMVGPATWAKLKPFLGKTDPAKTR